MEINDTKPSSQWKTPEMVKNKPPMKERGFKASSFHNTKVINALPRPSI